MTSSVAQTIRHWPARRFAVAAGVGAADVSAQMNNVGHATGLRNFTAVDHLVRRVVSGRISHEKFLRVFDAEAVTEP